MRRQQRPHGHIDARQRRDRVNARSVFASRVDERRMRAVSHQQSDRLFDIGRVTGNIHPAIAPEPPNQRLAGRSMVIEQDKLNPHERDARPGHIRMLRRLAAVRTGQKARFDRANGRKRQG